MVFEGILVDVLNRFIGSYVKNIDASQLKVGIFGGDVLLEKLDLKENALDDLNLPIRIFGGHLAKLRLKVPWKNLYSAPVVAEVDGLYVIVGPASATKYDAERDAKEKKDNKDRQLKKIEDARKKSLEAKEKKDEAPGFVEKLVTQIIKNVQITVRNIHVTYEDQVTDPAHPFSVGVSLDSLVVLSTDKNYEIGSKDSDPTSQLIYKLVNMSCLSLYWNTDTKLLGSDNLPPDWAGILKERIARSGSLPDSQYLLQPISAEARLQLTMKPGTDSDIPQALVTVVLEHIGFSLRKQQYRNLVSLIESFDRMSINQKYLKYKPWGVRVKEDRGAWWRYAITSVLQEDVKRRTRMWSWKHIKKHRLRCKKYTELYEEKLLSKKVPEELNKKLEVLESGLDVVNITLCRQLAENKAARKRTAREEQKAKSGSDSWWGWSTSWVTGSSGDTEPLITKPPTEEELAEEKRKLYQALGYSEKGVAATYSKEYVAHKVDVRFKKVSLELYNENGSVSQLLADRVSVAFKQRPASSNIVVTASLGSVTMNGRGFDRGKPPTIIETPSQTSSLLDVMFELNPLKKRADYSVKAQLKPIQIVYDADTIDAIIGMFLLPKDVQLQKLTAAASSTIEEVKTQGRAGLEHSINQKKVMELDISINSPYVIVPENGTLTQSSTVLLVDLGFLHVTSDPLQLDSVRNATMEQLQAAFYDNFNLQLTNLQVIVSGAGDDWKSARKASSSPLHILTPTKLDLLLKKSLMDDAKLPNIRVSGELPALKLSVSDKKIKQVIQIVQSLPLPPPSLASKTPSDNNYSYEADIESKVDTDELIHTLTPSRRDEAVSSDEEAWYTADEGVYDEETGTYSCSSSGKGEDTKKKESISVTKLELAFNIPEVKIDFSEHDDLSQIDKPRLGLVVTSISTAVKLRTWDLGVVASIRSLTIDDYYKREGVALEGPIRLLSAASNGEAQSKFLDFNYKKADSLGPHYQTVFSSTQQSIELGLSLLRLDLHRESLINLITISKTISEQLKSNKNATGDKLSSPSKTNLSSSSSIKLDQSTPSASKIVARIPGEKDLSVEARFSGIELTLSDRHGDLLSAKVTDLKTDVIIDETTVNVTASLSDIALLDSDPVSIHPNVIVKMDESTNVIATNVVVYKNSSKADITTADLSIKAKVHRVKVTVLFRFLNRIKVFVSEFLTQLKLDQQTIDSAREAAAKTATRTAEALKEQSSSRVQLDITVFAPVVILPLSCLSQSAFIADLGQLEVRNKFLEAKSVYGGKEGVFVNGRGEPAVVDRMSIVLSKIQLGRMVVFVLLTLLATLVLSGEISSHHYHIVPVNSTDLCEHYQAGSCLTLDQLSFQLKETSTGDITLSFLPGDHLLTWDLKIRGANEVTFSNEPLQSYSLSPARITCSDGYGISVKDTKLFTMEGLVLYGCKREKSGLLLLDNTSAKIIFSQFTNNSVISGSGGALTMTGGRQCHAVIEACTFQFNRALEREQGPKHFLVDGGALNIMGLVATITNTSFIGNSAVRMGGAVYGSIFHVNILRCSFINNTANKGGGVAVAVKSSAHSSFNVYSYNSATEEGGAVYVMTSIIFESVTDYFHGNHAHRGSAIISEQSNTTFTNCNITENRDGEGVVYLDRATMIFVENNSFTLNGGSLFAFYSEISFTGSTLFMNNTGDSGGAITSMSSTIVFQHSSQTVVIGNTAGRGGGIYLKQSTLTVYGDIVITENTAEVGGGGIYALQSTLQFGVSFLVASNDVSNKINVNYNEAKKYGGGVYLSESTISITKRNILILGNVAMLYGGGMYLDSTSLVTMKSDYSKIFLYLRSNSAVKGGGIYVADGSYNGGICAEEEENSCFVQTLASQDVFLPHTANYCFPTTIAFGNNTAIETGSDVYGGLLDRCSVSLTSTTLAETKSMNGLLFLKVFMGFGWAHSEECNKKIYGKATNISEFYNRISSDPVRVCFCEDDVIDCNSTHPTVFAKKGERFTVSLVALDQVGKPVNATIVSSLMSEKEEIGRFKEGQQFRQISDLCIQLEYNVYSSGATRRIELYADGPCRKQGISKQEIIVVFQPCTCPVGFERVPPNIDCSCDCDSRLSQYISNCSVNQGTVQEDSNVWIKYVNSTNTTDYVTHDCPLDYCVEKPVNISLSEEDEQCAFNRTGTLCGECKEGLSLVFASSNCQQCSNYYLFLLLPFALAGIALVAFILILNMTVATGTIHGLIFYANILAANRSIFLPFNTANFLTVFISWLNLDLGIETCFYSGLDSYGKLLLQLVFPAYVFLLIATIMVLCDRSQRIAGLFGKRNPEATLYTLVLLSYSKLIRLIITALQFTTISYPDGSKKIVWVYDANVLYFTASHIPRFIAAIMITLLGAVYTTLLLFGQLFNRLSEYRLMKWTTHKYYIHFLKAHHAPLCDKHRYWAGLLLLARLVHYLLSAFVGDSIVILSAIFLAFSLIAYKQVIGVIYRARWLDSLESLFLANLTVLGVSTYFVSLANRSQTTLAIVSMSVTFVAFLAVVLYHILQSCGVRPGKILGQALASLREHKRDNYEHVLTEENEEERWNDESLFEERDHENSVGREESVSDRDRYITPPIIRSAIRDDQLREPALDDLIPVRPEDYVQCGSIQTPQHQIREMKMFA